MSMSQLEAFDKSRVRVLLTWGSLYGSTLSESEFVEAVGRLPLRQVLPGLVRLFQFADAKEPPAYIALDGRVSELFPSKTGRWIADELSKKSHWTLFSRWQLLFAIKLVCTFGSRDECQMSISNDQFLELLLMTNEFYPKGESGPITIEGVKKDLKRTTLRGYSLIGGENPYYLIGRYSELFGQLAAPENRGEFNSWVDIRAVLSDKLGIQLDTFKAVLFGLFSSTISTSSTDDGKGTLELGCLDPKSFFADAEIPQEELNSTLELVSTSPDEIRDEHRSKYGNGIGNPVDHGILLRKPVIGLSHGRLAGISGQLLIQRYTCGLYWDINDALPNDKSIVPSRQMFQTFFGELHECYGMDTLLRMKDEQLKAKRQISLLLEQDYDTEDGPNPDSLVIERIGSSNTRCTLFEFKVGRPRYMDTIVQANVQAFEEDLSLKIEAGLDQEIGLCRQLLSGQRTVPGLSPPDVSAWIFVIVVTDPFPAMDILLERLKCKLAEARGLGKSKRYGPLILSLKELEQLERLPRRRVSQVLMDWAESTHRAWPFNTYFAKHTEGQAVAHSHVAVLAEEEFKAVTKLLGHPVFL